MHAVLPEKLLNDPHKVRLLDSVDSVDLWREIFVLVSGFQSLSYSLKTDSSMAFYHEIWGKCLWQWFCPSRAVLFRRLRLPQIPDRARSFPNQLQPQITSPDTSKSSKTPSKGLSRFQKAIKCESLRHYHPQKSVENNGAIVYLN